MILFRNIFSNSKVFVRCILLSCSVFVIIVIIAGVYHAMKDTPNHIFIDTPQIDLGKIVVGTVKVFQLKITNSSDSPVIINDIKTSCGCLVPVKKVSEIPKKQSIDLDFMVNILREGNNAYQILINSEQGNTIKHLEVGIKFFGKRVVRVMPAKRTITSFEKGIASQKLLSYYLQGLHNTSFVLNNVSVVHPKSHLQAVIKATQNINEGDTFMVTLKYDGLSTCGRWSDVLLFHGTDKNSGESLVFSSEITGCVICDKCKHDIGFSPTD